MSDAMSLIERAEQIAAAPMDAAQEIERLEAEVERQHVQAQRGYERAKGAEAQLAGAVEGRERYEEALTVIATYRDHADPMAQRLGTMAFGVLKAVRGQS
jgi:hypothetical protein